MNFRSILSKLYSKPYLIWTNTATGVISITIGDVIQQNLEHQLDKDVLAKSSNKINNKDTKNNDDNYKFEWNSKRTGNMMLAGVYFSIFGHWWYTFLDRKFPPKLKNSVRNKLIAESISGPLVVSSVFFLFGKVNGHSLENSWKNIRTNFGLICSAEWLIFIPIQYFNFKFVPAAYRYLYVATVSIGYDAFLSYVLNRNERYRQNELKRLKHKLSHQMEIN